MKDYISHWASRMRQSRLFYFFVFLSLVALFFVFRPNPTTNLILGQVQRLDLIQRVTIAGNVTANRRSIIIAPYNAYVRKIYVNIGDNIRKGDPLVLLSTSAQSGDAGFPLRSPMDGTVVQINKSEGEYARESDIKDFILRIDDTSRLFVNANAAEMDRVKIQKGQEAIVKATALLDKSYVGVIRDLSLAANEKEQWGRSQTVEFSIRAEITNKDDFLRPGMSVVLDVITAKKEKVLILRHEFIQRDQEKYFVTKQNGERKEIRVGLQNEDGFEIVDGLIEGDLIRQINFAELLKGSK